MQARSSCAVPRAWFGKHAMTLPGDVAGWRGAVVMCGCGLLHMVRAGFGLLHMVCAGFAAHNVRQSAAWGECELHIIRVGPGGADEYWWSRLQSV
jgi:hypothetical protein